MLLVVVLHIMINRILNSLTIRPSCIAHYVIEYCDLWKYEHVVCEPGKLDLTCCCCAQVQTYPIYKTQMNCPRNKKRENSDTCILCIALVIVKSSFLHTALSKVNLL